MSQIVKLSLQDVLAIRKRLSNTLLAGDDAFGLETPLYADKLESAVARQSTGFGSKDKYRTVPEVAATLFYGLAMNHAFDNGNKRTALVSMLVLLDRNRTLLMDATEEDLFDLVTTMVKHQLPIRQDSSAKRDDLEVTYVAKWLRERTRDLKLGDRHLEFRDFRSLLEYMGCTFDAPDKNYIKVRRGGHSFGMGYPKAKFTVDVQIIKDARRTLMLDEVHGVDSAAFYDFEGSVDIFVNTYRNLMRRLASA